MGHTFNRPDEAAMLRILERHPHSPEGAILRLAWLEGLSRSEITELRWDQVDFEGKAIQLPDRAVPLEPSTEACLRERHVRCALRDPHVVISERSKKPMPPESISRLSRLALDSEGQKVNLMDLRHDFVIRQLQTHDWPYVARVSGMAVSTLRDAFSPYLTKPAAPENPLAQRDEAEYLLWRVIQQEGSSPAGLALWMGWKLQMQPGEIASLIWEQVDFDQNLIRLPDRTVSMGSRLRRLLLDAWDRRKDPAEPRVFTAPTTGRPMDLSRLTTVTRTALIRGGLEHVNLRNLHTWVRQGDRAQLLMKTIEVDLKKSADTVTDTWTKGDGNTNENLWYTYTVKNDSYRLTLAANQIHDTKTDKIDSKHVSQKGVDAAQKPVDRFFYGNGDTKYISVDVDQLKTNAGLVVAIDDVNSVTEGVKNVSIDVYNKGEAEDAAGIKTGTKVDKTAYGIYSVYDGAYVVASIVVGDDGSVSDRYAYLYGEPNYERYDKANDVYYWEMDAVIDGVKTTVTFKTDLKFDDTIASKEQGKMFKLSYDKDGYVTKYAEIVKGTDYVTLGQSASVKDPEDLKIVTNKDMVVEREVQVKKDTLWITEQNAKRGFALADNCPAVIVEMNKDGNTWEIDKTSEYTTVEKAVRSMENYDSKNENATYEGEIYLMFKDGIVSSVIIVDYVTKDDHRKDDNVGDLTVGVVKVDTTNKKVVLDKDDKPEDGRAWTEAEKAAINTSVKAALIEAGYEATGDMTYQPDVIKAVNTNASNAKEFTFSVVWG